VGVERLVRGAQPRPLQLADPHEQPDPAQAILLGGELDLVDVDQLAPLAQVLVDGLEDAGGGQLVLGVAEAPLEGAAGAAVRGIDTEDAPVGLDGAGAVREVLLADLPEPVLELEVGGLVTLWLGANDRQLAAEDVGQLLVLAVALVDAIEGS